MLGGVIGLGLAAVLIPAISAGSGGMLNLPSPARNSWLLGLGADGRDRSRGRRAAGLRAMRLNIVDALAGPLRARA